MRSTPTLISNLGSWSIVPSVLLKLREEGIQVSRVFLIATDNQNLSGYVEKISNFCRRHFSELTLNVIVTQNVQDIFSLADADASRSAIFSTCAMASSGDLNYYCIAGGRKSMSSDLQAAANFFGAQRVFHFLQPIDFELNPNLRAQFDAELETSEPHCLEVIIRKCSIVDLPHFPRSSGYEINAKSFEEIAKKVFSEFSRFESSSNAFIFSHSARERDALKLAMRCMEDTSSLMMNFHRHSAPPWNSLLLLSPTSYRKLEDIKIEGKEFDRLEPLLKRLPKAELHCHIGGILDLEAQINIGKSLWSQLTTVEKDRAAKWLNTNLGPLIENLENRWTENSQAPYLSDLIRAAGELRPSVCAAALSLYPQEILSELLWPKSLKRHGIAFKYDFKRFEEPGELSGSAVLRDRRCLNAYAKEIVKFAYAHNLRICEIRCSPAKYIGTEINGFKNQLDFVLLLKKYIDSEIETQNTAEKRVRIGIILICDRRNPAGFSETVSTLLQIQESFELQNLRDFVVGIDVAGDELNSADPTKIAAALSEVRAQSLHTTIHAGETAEGGAVWNAIHMFSADRVGHALTLLNDKKNGENLVKKLKDRRITIELCPTSNVEVVGYGNDPESNEKNDYPLLAYMEKNLRVALCTDNPGICRTTPSKEFFIASQLSKHPLTLLDCLKLIKNSFSGSFLPADELRQIIESADAEIHDLISSELKTLF